MLRIFVIFLFGLVWVGSPLTTRVTAREISILEDLSIQNITHGDWSIIEQYDRMQREVSTELDALDRGGFLIVGLKSKVNLAKMQEKGHNIWLESWFCRIPDTVAYLAFPSIFMGKVDISGLGTMRFFDGGSGPSASSANKATALEGGSYIYEIIIKTDWVEETPLHAAFRRDKNQENFFIYDLTEEPMDICFYLNVGPLRKSNRSKILVLDENMIRKVLSEEN